jgi:hypothetical protein
VEENVIVENEAMASALEEAQESEASLGEWFSDADFSLSVL